MLSAAKHDTSRGVFHGMTRQISFSRHVGTDPVKLHFLLSFIIRFIKAAQFVGFTCRNGFPGWRRQTVEGAFGIFDAFPARCVRHLLIIEIAIGILVIYVAKLVLSAVLIFRARAKLLLFIAADILFIIGSLLLRAGRFLPIPVLAGRLTVSITG